jgi:hypothetical protein
LTDNRPRVFAAKQNTHRPGIAPALGLRAGTDHRSLVPQTASFKEIFIMWPTFFTRWRTRFGKAPRLGGSRQRPAWRRPRLEGLEDRTAPAALGYSTYFHGSVQAIAVDNTGAVYVTGSADSTLPTTPGAFRTSGAGAFVAKLNATGTAVVWATYLGNSSYNNSDTAGYGIALDAAGDVYVIGSDPTVPTTANAIASSGTIFVAELNSTGSSLQYSTYLPGGVGAGNIVYGDTGAIAVDGSGNIYVAGAARAGFPVTASAFQTAYLGSDYNGFFAKINPALSGSASLEYATYLGGSNRDAVSGIALDGSGNVYLTGFTVSSDFPRTSGAFQTTFVGLRDAFVAKVNPSLSGASSLVYSTLLGGSLDVTGGNAITGYVPDIGGTIVLTNQTDGGIAVDNAGNVYVASSTTAINFPTTPGAFQTQSNLQYAGSGRPSDAFVTKLNATGTALIYSTYLGGGTDTNSGASGIALDANGDAYVTGWTSSTVFPTKNPVQATNAGGFNAFVTELNPSGSGLLFSSYLGGSYRDWGYGIALDPSGNAYVGGQTVSSNFPTTPGAYQTNYYTGITYNGFVAKFDTGSPTFVVTGFPSPTTAGAAATFTITVQDANGDTLTGYTGTIHFTSSDPQASLPADDTFTVADQGSHTFSATLKTAGSQAIYATDTTTPNLDGGQLFIQVNPAAATHFVLSGPSSITAGTAFSITVTALDAYGNIATGYRGTVHFTSSDSRAGLPRDYIFTGGDNGVHVFSGVKLRTKGLETIAVVDTLFGSIIGSFEIEVK